MDDDDFVDDNESAGNASEDIILDGEESASGHSDDKFSDSGNDDCDDCDDDCDEDSCSDAEPAGEADFELDEVINAVDDGADDDAEGKLSDDEWASDDEEEIDPTNAAILYPARAKPVLSTAIDAFEDQNAAEDKDAGERCAPIPMPTVRNNLENAGDPGIVFATLSVSGFKKLMKNPSYRKMLKQIREISLHPATTGCLEDRVFEAMFRSVGLNASTRESYQQMLDTLLPDLIRNQGPLVIRHESVNLVHTVTFGRVYYSPPCSNDAGSIKPTSIYTSSMRRCPYVFSVFLDVLSEVRDGNGNLVNKTMFPQFPLTQFPAMTNTQYCMPKQSQLNNRCPYTEDTVFPMKGGPKAVLSQEIGAPNTIFCFKQSAKIRVEYRSLAEGTWRSTSTLFALMNCCTAGDVPTIEFHMPYVATGVPVVTMFTVLGVTRPKVMYDMIVSHLPSKIPPTLQRQIESVILSIVSAPVLETTATEGQTHADVVQEIFAKISKSQTQRRAEDHVSSVSNLFLRELLPNIKYKDVKAGGLPPGVVPDPETPYEGDPVWNVSNARDAEVSWSKAFTIAQMVAAGLSVMFGLRKVDSRDSVRNKRYIGPADLILRLVQHQLRKFIRLVYERSAALVDGQPFTLKIPDVIWTRVMKALARGVWGTGSNETSRISDAFDSEHRFAGISQLRRTCAYDVRKSKSAHPRLANPDFAQLLCPIETPESQQTGLVKQLAIGARISTCAPSALIVSVISQLPGLIPLTQRIIYKDSDIASQDRGTTTNAWADLVQGNYGVDDVVQSMDICSSHQNLYKVGLRGDINVDLLLSAVTVYVNSIPYWFTKNPEDLMLRLREYKQTLNLPYLTTIMYYKRERAIHIRTDSGRLASPYLVVRKAEYLAKIVARFAGDWKTIWSQLIATGVVEYLTSEEELMFRIASSMRDLDLHMAAAKRAGLSIKYDYAVLHQNWIYGAMSMLGVFSHHNQGPRNVYATAMMKQVACAQNALNEHLCQAHVTYTLQNAETPSVESIGGQLMYNDKFSGGHNVLVAATYGGEGATLEDAIVVNKRFLQLGGWRVVTKRIVSKQERRSGHDQMIIEKPNPAECTSLRSGNYDTIQANGLPLIGQLLQRGDAVIGCTTVAKHALACGVENPAADTMSQALRDKKKAAAAAADGDGSGVASNTRAQPKVRFAIKPKTSETFAKYDSSIMYTENTPGRVVSVRETTTAEGERIAYVEIATVSASGRGRKFSSRHGQKGTCGYENAHENMPFDPYTGEVVTVLMGNVGLLKRMTAGQVLESTLGLLCASLGITVNGTAFLRKRKHWDFTSLLKALGLSPNGTRQLINGETGEPFEGVMFAGMVYYRIQHQMPDNKMKVRSQGPRAVLTRQPCEGKEGGIRGGTMEADATRAYGASDIYSERFFGASDGCTALVCGRCGSLAVPPPPDYHADIVSKFGDKAWCPSCLSTVAIKSVETTYAFTRLAVQELSSASMGTAIATAPGQVPVKPFSASAQGVSNPIPASVIHDIAEIYRAKHSQ